MDFRFNEQHKMLKKSARDFFAKEMPSKLVKDLQENPRGYSVELYQKMADLGWLGLTIPEELGGCGGNFVDLAVLLEEMGRACVPGPLFSTLVVGAGLLLQAGNAEQKDSLLPRVAEGKVILTAAILEPEAQHNPEAMKAMGRPAGDAFVLDGTKLFVTDAHVADYLIVAAKAEEGLTLFVVDAKDPGVKVTVTPTMGDKQCEVVLEGVKVAKQNVVGEMGSGWQHWQAVSQRAAVAKCAEMIGGAQRALELTVDYARQRMQFSKAIGSFQAVQHHCANMATDTEGAMYLTYQAAWMLSEALPCAREVAIAKAWTSEAYKRSTALGIEVHGGIGFCMEHDMPLYYKQAKTGEVAFGDTAYHEEIVARELGL